MHEMKHGEVALVFIELPAKGRHLDDDKYNAFWTTVCHWARMCRDVGAQLTIFGRLGKLWREPFLESMVSEKLLHKIVWEYNKYKY